MFLFVMAGLAAVDWVIADVVIRGWPAIIDLILYGELYDRSYPPLPSGRMFLPCPGNGFAFFCGPWAISLIFLFTLTIGIGLYVKVTRAWGLGKPHARGSPLDRRRLFVYLSLVASMLLAFAFLWGWVQFFLISGSRAGITLIYRLVVPFIHALFILVSIGAGRHLRRVQHGIG